MSSPIEEHGAYSKIRVVHLRRAKTISIVILRHIYIKSLCDCVRICRPLHSNSNELLSAMSDTHRCDCICIASISLCHRSGCYFSIMNVFKIFCYYKQTNKQNKIFNLFPHFAAHDTFAINDF